MADRAVKCTRKTSETDIVLELNLDGKGDAKIDTGIGFFDHMLTSFAKHGFFDLNLTVKGDLYVDCHHTIEDTGIVLGKAIKGALGDKKSIKRFGNFFLPMDETLVMCAIDLPLPKGTVWRQAVKQMPTPPSVYNSSCVSSFKLLY